MTEWFKQYWWAIWGVGCAAAIFFYRMRNTGADNLPRAIAYALFPVLNPESEDNKRLPIRLMLVVSGLAVILVFIGLVRVFVWWKAR